MSAAKEAPGLVFEVPLDTQGGDNNHEERWSKHRRQQREKKAVGLVCASYQPALKVALRTLLRAMAHKGPLDVRVVRLYTGTRGCDPQNLGSRLKGIIDGLALVFGINDGNTARVRYIPGQERAKMPGVRVEVSARKPEVQGPGWTAEDWKEVAVWLKLGASNCELGGLREKGAWAERLSEEAEAMARALGGGG